MNIITITRQQAEQFFKKYPMLIEIGFDDELIAHFHKTGDVIITDQFFVGLEIENELNGVWCFSTFTNNTLNCHAYINPKFHGAGVSFDLWECTTNHIKEFAPTITNIMMMVPEPCKHIIKMAELHNFRLDGAIPKGVVWRGKPTTLYIYIKGVHECHN